MKVISNDMVRLIVFLLAFILAYILCIVFDIQTDIGRNGEFFIPHRSMGDLVGVSLSRLV